MLPARRPAEVELFLWFLALLQAVRARRRTGKRGFADAGKAPFANVLGLLQAFSVLPWPNATAFTAAADPSTASFL
jgi:hypothetical protein